MAWKMTITALPDDPSPLEVSADTLEDLVWRVQIAHIDGDGAFALTPDPSNPHVSIDEYARLLAIDPTDNPPTPRDTWPPFDPDPTEPTGLFEVEAHKTWILSRPLRQAKLARVEDMEG